MTEEALRYFARMFTADRHMAETKWFEQFPMYKFDCAMGAKPFWPPLSEVWYVGEACPYHDRNAATASWGDASACLQQHYEQYEDAKRKKKL